jgi:hypothetical protein
MNMPYCFSPVEYEDGERPLEWMGRLAQEATAKEQARAAEADEGKQK